MSPMNPMNRIIFDSKVFGRIVSVGALLAFVLTGEPPDAWAETDAWAESKRPNVVLIITDDQGYGDSLATATHGSRRLS